MRNNVGLLTFSPVKVKFPHGIQEVFLIYRSLHTRDRNDDRCCTRCSAGPPHSLTETGGAPSVRSLPLTPTPSPENWPLGAGAPDAGAPDAGGYAPPAHSGHCPTETDKTSPCSHGTGWVDTGSPGAPCGISLKPGSRGQHAFAELTACLPQPASLAPLPPSSPSANPQDASPPAALLPGSLT